jgi:hypothetical protein
MQIKKSSIAILSSLLFWGCSNAEFLGTAGKTSKDGDKKSSDSSEEEDDERAAEPVPVGGAYLACSYAVVPDAAANEAYVGCGVYQDVMALAEVKRSKLDVPDSAIEWSIRDSNNNPVANLIFKVLPESKLFHRVYKYQGTAYRSFSVAVSVKDNRGGEIRLEKHAVELKDVDDEFEPMKVHYLVQPEHSKMGPVAFCSDGDCSNWSSVDGFKDKPLVNYRKNDFCNGLGVADWGLIHSAFPLRSGAKDLVIEYKQTTFSASNSLLRSGDLCLVDNSHVSIKVEDNGCIIVPWFYKNEKAVHFGIFNERSRETSLDNVKKMVAQFNCDNAPLEPIEQPGSPNPIPVPNSPI